MDALGWRLSGGWSVPSSRNYPGETVYALVHEKTGLMSYVPVPTALPDQLRSMHLMYLLHKEIERLTVALDAVAMYGGGDVRPKPDGA